jgi:hypothetical protein
MKGTPPTVFAGAWSSLTRVFKKNKIWVWSKCDASVS